jgi:hypothetical protein
MCAVPFERDHSSFVDTAILRAQGPKWSPFIFALPVQTAGKRGSGMIIPIRGKNIARRFRGIAHGVAGFV